MVGWIEVPLSYFRQLVSSWLENNNYKEAGRQDRVENKEQKSINYNNKFNHEIKNKNEIKHTKGLTLQ